MEDAGKVECPTMAVDMATASVVLAVPAAAQRLQCEEVSLLVDNLRLLVNDPDYGDVHFICRDGVTVHASRLLLMARSPMLRCLLTNGKAETTLSEIPLPDITYVALLTVLEFLYTGSIKRYKLTLLSAFATLHASRFLKLDRLDEYVMLFLTQALMPIREFDLLAWCFTQFAELSAKGWPVLDKLPLADLIQKMATKLYALKPDRLKFLSGQAFNLYLDATKSANFTTISFKEYLRLRSILLWACFRACPQAEAVLQVLEPLEIIPPSIFLEALKYQVLHRGDLGTMRWHNSHWDGGVKVRESGILLHVEKTTLGSPVHVRGTMPINHGMCEWDIVIKAPCGLLFIGIYEPRHRTSSKCALVDRKQWSRYLSSQGRLCVGDIAGEVYCKSFGQTADSKVRVHVDMKQRTCAFTVDGHRSGVAWSVPRRCILLLCPRNHAKSASGWSVMQITCEGGARGKLPERLQERL